MSATAVCAAIAAGIGLAACSGLRAFLPLFAAGLAARFLNWPLAPHVAWLASNAALVAFGIGAVLEIVADKVPFLDHGLDLVHTLVAPVVAVLVSVSAWTQLAPSHGLLLSLLAGAPVALAVHTLAATARVTSSAASAGIANPVLSVGEDVTTIIGLLLAFLAPLVLGVALVAVIGVRRMAKSLTTRRPPQGDGVN
jgi:predicted permease